MVKLDEIGLQIDSPLVVPTAKNFRPPIWPPPWDWPVVIDAEGKVICLWSDPVWNLAVWAGRGCSLNFGDGKRTRSRIDPANADLLRLLVTWRVWGKNGVRTTGNLMNFFMPVRAIVALCSREGILASELMRFPMVAAKVPQVLAKSKFDVAIGLLHSLLDAQEVLGFVLFDRQGLKRLLKARPDYDKGRTPYIPPRIWGYQLKRLRVCLDDFLAHREQIEGCFKFCTEAYARNYGSLTKAHHPNKSRARYPFQNPPNENAGGKTGCIFHGPFALTVARFGIDSLLDRWCDENNGKRTLGITRLASYLIMISYVGMAYLLNFSLMRAEEAWKLHADCLLVEKDEKLGDIYMLRGETTKTDPDADARWPTSPSVKVAIEAMTSVARLRMLCAIHDPVARPSPSDIANPYLYGRAYEPWVPHKPQPYLIRPSYKSYLEVLVYAQHLFDPKELTITEQDLQLARLIEPGLNQDVFKVGAVWPLAWHQLRRTGAVNMLSSGLVSDASLQYQMKHLSRVMTLYYGHNYSRLSLDPETRGLFLRTMYETQGKVLAQLTSSQFKSPHGEARKTQIVSFISVSDANTLENAGRKGEVSARQIRLGFCMKRGNCTYGGIESVVHCGGGDTGKPCSEVLYDKEKFEKNKRYSLDVESRLASSSPDSARHKWLLAEKKSLENYFAVIAS